MAKSKKKKRKQTPKGNQPKPTTKRKRQRRQGNRTLLRVILLLIILVTGIVLSFTVFFKIENIIVVGLEHYEPQEIINATGIKIDDNLFLVDTKNIEKNLLQSFPYLEEVSVLQTFPPSIEIRTTPSVAVAALEQSANDYILITYQGKILEQGLALPSWDALLVHGVPLEGMEAGDVLGEWKPEPKGQNESLEDVAARKERDALREATAEDQIEVMRMLRYLFEAMADTGFDSITNIDLTDRYNMKVRYENRLLLELGSETDLSYKLQFVQEVLQQHLHPDAPGILNLAEIRKQRVYYKFPEGYREDGTRLEDPPFHPDENYLPQQEEKISLEISPATPDELEGIPLIGEPQTEEIPEDTGASSVTLPQVDAKDDALSDEGQSPSSAEEDSSDQSDQIEIPLETLE